MRPVIVPLAKAGEGSVPLAGLDGQQDQRDHVGLLFRTGQ
jgi:hypothetical protein